MTMNHQVRPATPEDEPFLKELFRDVRAHEFQPLNLHEAALTQLLDLQFLAQKTSYTQQFRDLENSVVWVGPYRVGRVLISHDTACIRLVDIALLTPFRGQGIGHSLMEALCRRASAAAIPLRLSVRTENPARRLYTRLGFVPCQSDSLDVEMVWGGNPSAQTVAGIPANEFPIIPGPNSAYFRTLLGTQAVLESSFSARITLTLTSVQSLAPDRNPSVSMGDSFRLTFQGEASSLLPQGSFPLIFRDGHQEEIFLVPIKVEGSVATYESIYNRMTFTRPPE